ncbi:hypothetical protein ACFR99_14460 [Haloarchaeobius amylolyticus]|uniref:Uncharacterized protein n=1 Tax=Haloarchaeobius amylolyticus TaxID=1198296 RepID=A0ABD6BIA9_9EURY
MIGSQHHERGVSISVTHVLTLGITTILVAMLLVSASTMLETEQDRNTEASLETVGERIAHDIGVVDQAVDDRDDSVAVTTDQPRQAGNSRYTVTMRNRSVCKEAPLLNGSNDCLHLTADGTDTEAYIPIEADEPIKNGSSASGGRIKISYTGDEIQIRGENR